MFSHPGQPAALSLELTRFLGHLILGRVSGGRRPGWVIPAGTGKSSGEKPSSCIDRRIGPGAEVARSLGISDGSLAAWVKQAREAERPGALDVDERAGLERLCRQNRELRMDREILRKAAAYFARETNG